MHDTPLDFSIIVPTYERPAQLDACLQSLRDLAYDRDRYEVIVVDDGGRARIAPIVHRAALHLNLRLLVAPHAGPAAARNVGATAARGRFLAFTDDDCCPSPEWLSGLADAFRQHPHDLVGGRTVNALAGNPYSTASQITLDLVYRYFNATPDNARFFASNNLAIARAHFFAVGGFDKGWKIVACEDRDFCDRWTHHGGRLIWAPAAIVRHAHPHVWSSYCRQYFTHGRGAFHYHRLRRRRGSGRLLDDLRFHAQLRNWLIRPFRTDSGIHPLRLSALLGLWQVANAAGYVFESVSRRAYRSRDEAMPIVSEPSPVIDR